MFTHLIISTETAGMVYTPSRRCPFHGIARWIHCSRLFRRQCVFFAYQLLFVHMKMFFVRFGGPPPFFPIVEFFLGFG